VVWSFVYVALRRVLGLVVLRGRSQRAKDLELIVLRHEIEVLRRQVRRVELRPADRAFLAAASRVLSRRSWGCFADRRSTLRYASSSSEWLVRTRAGTIAADRAKRRQPPPSAQLPTVRELTSRETGRLLDATEG
jgi:hypothetical protein